MSKLEITEHAFTSNILDILKKHFGEDAQDVFTASSLLGYLNKKTKSANQGSKARGSFANIYALYAIIEDYLNNGFFDGTAKVTYSKYEGARFSDLLRRQRELPFGKKLQNHALNARLNDEFKKFYPTVTKQPIVRDVKNQKYWIQEDLLQVTIRTKDGCDATYNIANVVMDIIDSYIAVKKSAFEGFLEACGKITALGKEQTEDVVAFVVQQLQPNVDARIFEIMSYAILQAKYGQQTVWIGDTESSVAEERLVLYKTGRTNANDGGIDFVMKPLGRFFQVTETLDMNKYFLDIDKVQRFPLTFVIKSNQTIEQLYEAIKEKAIAKYKIESVVKSYMEAVEGIINIPILVCAFAELVKLGKLQEIMDTIMTQSKLEFNYGDDEIDT